MKRHWVLFIVSVTLGAVSLFAQGTPYSAEAKRSYTRIKNNLLAAAEKMPEENYGFKASPEVRPFGQLIAHVADAQFGICSAVKGEEKKGDAASKTTKSDLITALKASFDYCDGAYDSVNDTTAQQMVPLFGTQFSKLSVLYLNVSHDNEMYGTMAVYMRLKGIVPPSSQRQAGK